MRPHAENTFPIANAIAQKTSINESQKTKSDLFHFSVFMDSKPLKTKYCLSVASLFCLGFEFMKMR